MWERIAWKRVDPLLSRERETATTVRPSDFPHFVASLDKDVFEAIVDASREQAPAPRTSPRAGYGPMAEKVTRAGGVVA